MPSCYSNPRGVQVSSDPRWPAWCNETDCPRILVMMANVHLFRCLEVKEKHNNYSHKNTDPTNILSWALFSSQMNYGSCKTLCKRPIRKEHMEQGRGKKKVLMFSVLSSITIMSTQNPFENEMPVITQISKCKHLLHLILKHINMNGMLIFMLLT